MESVLLDVAGHRRSPATMPAVIGSPMSISFLRACDEIARYVRDGTARLEHEPHTTIHQPI
jgi:hypothetical protein